MLSPCPTWTSLSACLDLTGDRVACSSRYFYFLFLLPLLLDRSFRDEQRCSLKYTTAWQEYKRRVPARIVPGIF